MKYILYFDFSSYNDKKITQVSLGNPGIGGTQYLFLELFYFYNKLFENKSLQLYYIGEIQFQLDCKVNPIKINCFQDLSLITDINDVIILRENDFKINLDTINKNNFNVFIWAHNTIDYITYRKILKTDKVLKIICVSEQQYLNMKDSKLKNRVVYINNFLPKQFLKIEVKHNNTNNDIIYIGAAVPQKGMHDLIKIWKYIERKKPNLKLHIVGGSRLRSLNETTGTMQIASTSYEKKLIRLVKKLSHPRNVIFHNVLDWNEIMTLLENCTLGIVNPSHFYRDETFCLSAVELSSKGIPVISRKRNDGLNTTIINSKTGLLLKSNKKIANQIITLSEDVYRLNLMSKNAIKHSLNFNEDIAINQWNQLFTQNHNVMHFNRPKGNYIKEGFLTLIDYVRKKIS